MTSGKSFRFIKAESFWKNWELLNKFWIQQSGKLGFSWDNLNFCPLRISIWVPSFQIILYLYNYSSEAAERVHQKVSDVISWQNARSRLLREIGLHKMGITHLPARLAKNHELIWLFVQLLHEHEYPMFGDPVFEDKYIFLHLRQFASRHCFLRHFFELFAFYWASTLK